TKFAVDSVHVCLYESLASINPLRQLRAILKLKPPIGRLSLAPTRAPALLRRFDRGASGVSNEEGDSERRPGMLRRCRIVARGHKAPKAGRLALRQVDPIRRSAQSEWSGRGRHPALAVAALLDPHEVLAKAGIGGLVDANAPDRLRLRKGVADPSAV